MNNARPAANIDDIRGKLIDVSVRGQRVAIRFYRDNLPCVAVGKVVIVDARAARLDCLLHGEAYVLLISSIREVVELAHDPAAKHPEAKALP